MPGRALQDRIAALRRFNRFYTRKLGVLEEHFLHSPFSLAEARVLYELAQGDRATAKAIGQALGLDAAFISSRILDRFARAPDFARGLARGRPAKLACTHPERKGRVRAARPALARGDRRDAPRAAGARSAATRSSGGHDRGAACRQARGGEPKVSLRQAKVGDFGWIVSRHGALYAEEYGWNESFEALVAEIVAAFIKERDAKRERCWIAELDGERAGSVTLVRESDKAAKLRLLFVEPDARGLGVGRRLVEECIRFARAAATARSRCGRTAFSPPRARFISARASTRCARSRTQASARSSSANIGN